MTIRAILRRSLGIALLLVAPAAASDVYPSRTVRIMVPVAGGGPLDLVARNVADTLTTSLKQPFIIENRPGAGGNLAADAVAKAAPDGHTLLLALSGTLAANPSYMRKMPFNPATDLDAIALVARTNVMLAVHPSVPAHTMREYVALAKRQSITYAHAGYGSGGHLSMEFFRLLAGFEAIPVGYRGNAQLVLDMVAGQVQSGFVASAGVIPHVREGRLRGLATSASERSPLVPDVPTVAEAGYPELKLGSRFVLMAPAKTPLPIIAILEREAAKAIMKPDLVAKLRRQDIVPVGSSAAEAKIFLRDETLRWADIARRSKADKK